MVGGLREGVAAGRGLRTLLQLSVERLDDFIFLLQLLAQPACGHKDDSQLLHFQLSEMRPLVFDSSHDVTRSHKHMH